MNNKLKIGKVPVSTSLKITGVLFIIALLGVQLYRFYWPSATISMGGNELRVQIADNTYRQHKGLGGRDSLGDYDGMLFIFPSQAKYAFVMRDTRFPIDIIWLSSGQVVDIAPSVQPEPMASEADLKRYSPRKPANMVLETRAGWALEHGLKIGDQLQVKGDWHPRVKLI